MPTAGSDVILRRVRLQGRAPSPARARQDPLKALDETPWPRTAPGEVFLLRSVKATGTPQSIALALAREVERLLAQATDGWAQGAEHAPAIRFRSRTDQQACLLRDLLEDRLQGRWYWADWQRQAPAGASAALVQALQEEPLAMAAVLERLADSPATAAFWKVLEAPDALHLLHLIGHASGWSGPIQAALEGAMLPAPPSPSLPLRMVATVLPPGLPPQDPRVVLAALLALWQEAPGLLQGSRGAPALRAAAWTLAAPPKSKARPADPLQPGSGQHHADATPLPAPQQRTSAPTLLVKPPKPTEAPKGASLPPPPRPADAPSPSAATAAEALGLQALTEAVAPLPESLVPVSPGLLVPPGCEWEVCTTQGGLFFLLNALAWEVYQERLQDWGAPGGGWRLMWRLGLALGCRPDRGLEALLLQEGALDERGLQGLAPLADPLARLGALRYGAAAWNAALFAIPARVRVTRSHVDAHFRLEDVRLEVRRAGLDLNPGWLPWLGRVVTFHFGSSLEPEQP